MIKKSIYTAVVLLILFEVFIRTLNIQWDTSQNDKSANLITAQNFIYNFPDKEISHDTVIVGSSISRKLITDSLGKNYLNLAFNAWSSYEGLELLNLTKKKPACVMIEMNVVGDTVMEQDVLNSMNALSFNVNELFKSFQLQNQPVGILIGYFKNKLKAKMEELKRKKRENQDLYKYNLQQEKETMTKILPDSVFSARFNVLSKLVETFKKENINIIFFEIPMDNELENTPLVLTTRALFHKYFPDSTYRYIAMQSTNKYIYSDGIHLSLQSALPYTLYLKNAINNRN